MTDFFGVHPATLEHSRPAASCCWPWCPPKPQSHLSGGKGGKILGSSPSLSHPITCKCSSRYLLPPRCTGNTCRGANFLRGAMWWGWWRGGGIAAESVLCRRNWPLVPPLSRRWQRRIIVTDGQPLDVLLPVLGHWLVEGGLEADVGNAVLLCHSLILQSTAQPMCNAGM